MSQGTPSNPVPMNYAPNQSEEETILGHPKGLFVLFGTELWERFNYYGMRALLTLYMVQMLKFDDKLASGSYGAYNGLAYAMPLIGGLLADRLLGYRRAIFLGGIMMAIGEFGLALAGFGVIPQNLYTFYASLGFIIIGNGFFKPNISTMVGTLYKQGDPRRDGAFTIFYMGINIGASSPLIVAPVAAMKGFHWGFGMAGVGMVFGLICFALFQRMLVGRGDPPKPVNATASSMSMLTTLTYILAFVGVPLAAFLVSKPFFVAEWAAPIAGVCCLAYVFFEASRSTPDERKGIYVILTLSLFSIMFWAFFEQAGSSMTLFTERHVNRFVGSYEIPTAMFQSVNAIFIVLLAPVFSWMWLRLSNVGKNPSSAIKFSLGLLQVGLGFIAMVLAAKQAAGGGKSALILLLLAYLLHTTGELCLSPVGLSMVTKMAPTRLASFLMGMWFLCTAFAHIVGGVLSGMSADWGFETLYTRIVYMAVGSSVLLLICSPILKKWERERLESHQRVKPSGFPVTVACAHCGSTDSRDGVYCAQCGQPLAATAAKSAG